MLVIILKFLLVRPYGPGGVQGFCSAPGPTRFLSANVNGVWAVKHLTRTSHLIMNITAVILIYQFLVILSLIVFHPVHH